jgi:hypothetical protein
MSAAAVVLLALVDSAAVALVVLQVLVALPVRVVLQALVAPVPVPHEPALLALAQQHLQARMRVVLVVPARVPVLAHLAVVPAAPLLPHLLQLLLPQVVVESEAPLHLQGRQWFSAAMARNSPPTGKPTYEPAPSTR